MATDSSSTRSVATVAIVVLILVALGAGWRMFGDDLGRDKNDIRIEVPGGKR